MATGSGFTRRLSRVLEPRKGTQMRNRILVVQLAFAAALAALFLVPTTSADVPCDVRNSDNTNELLECVTVEGVREHQAALQAIADANGGNRASGAAGHDASVDYIVDQMTAAGYDVTVQEFDFPFFQELEPPVLEQISPIPTTYEPEVDFFTMQYSGSGDVTATVQAVDLVLPPAPVPSSTSGCEAADFAGFAAGNIALIQRGTCTFATKAQNAEAAGAVGVIIFNEGQPGRTDAFAGTLGGPVVGISVVGASFALGVSLATVPVPVIHMDISTVSEIRTTANVLAETVAGRGDNVVMAGAHLDSVAEGPGINDNGSGSAALLEIALQMKKVKPRNQVRFAWWGAEEAGLLGSDFYVSSLSQDELDGIALYLNFDMIGSPNFVRFVYDGDSSDLPGVAPPGSEVIEQLFLDYFDSQGLPTEPTEVGARSDHAPFAAAGIPVGGLFTGAEGIKTAEEAGIYGGTAGEPYDPCYHTACDTFDNVSLEALDQNSDATAFAVLTYAMNTESMNGEKGKGNFKP